MAVTTVPASPVQRWDPGPPSSNSHLSIILMSWIILNTYLLVNTLSETRDRVHNALMGCTPTGPAGDPRAKSLQANAVSRSSTLRLVNELANLTWLFCALCSMDLRLMDLRPVFLLESLTSYPAHHVTPRTTEMSSPVGETFSASPLGGASEEEFSASPNGALTGTAPGALTDAAPDALTDADPGALTGAPGALGGGAPATGAAGDPRAKNLQANAVPGSTTLRMTSDNETARFYLDVTLRKKLNGSLPRVSLGATDVLSSASCGPENNGNVLPSSGETFSEPSALPIKKIGGP